MTDEILLPPESAPAPNLPMPPADEATVSAAVAAWPGEWVVEHILPIPNGEVWLGIRRRENPEGALKFTLRTEGDTLAMGAAAPNGDFSTYGGKASLGHVLSKMGERVAATAGV